MSMNTGEFVELAKSEFPEGTRVKLVQMYDAQPVPPGTYGTVAYVDDIGTIHVKWDNGSSLGLILGVDKFEKIFETS